MIDVFPPSRSVNIFPPHNFSEINVTYSSHSFAYVQLFELERKAPEEMNQRWCSISALRCDASNLFSSNHRWTYSIDEHRTIRVIDVFSSSSSSRYVTLIKSSWSSRSSSSCSAFDFCLHSNWVTDFPFLFLWKSCRLFFVEKLSTCQTALGMQSGSILDSAISASSSYDPNTVGPKASRSVKEKICSISDRSSL